MRATTPEASSELVPLRFGPLSRRRFLQLLGTVGVAGLPGCFRPPPDEVLPYAKQPENVQPGLPLHFATTLALDGALTGVIVTSHEGRPTKIEGNPAHPQSLGSTGAWEQAALLDLYDPQRLQVIRHGTQGVARERFLVEMQALARSHEADGGAGLHLLLAPTTSPLVIRMIDRLRARFPRATVHVHRPAPRDAGARAARLALGQPLETRAQLDRADTIVSLGADFLAFGPDRLRNARGWAQRRTDPKSMNRLYVTECELTLAGSVADHRLAAKPSELPQVAARLVELVARRIEAGHPLASLGTPKRVEAQERWLRAASEDLLAHRGRCAIFGGDALPLKVAAIALNAMLAGDTVEHFPSVEHEPEAGPLALYALADAINANRVRTLISTAFDPVYTAPADLDLAAALARVPTVIQLAPTADRTTPLAHWSVPASHPLESWGDARALDGTTSIIQPLIAPLYDSFTEAELLSAFADPAGRRARELLLESWHERLGADFDGRWRNTLQDGFAEGSASSPVRPSPDWAALRAELAKVAPPPSGRIELGFSEDRRVRAGELAHNAWLQECPDPLTQLTWGNALLLNPRTAQELDLHDGEVVELTHDGRTLLAPVLLQAGHAEGAGTLHLGYGRPVSSEDGPVGVDAYRLRTRAALAGPIGAEVRKTGMAHEFALIQITASDQARPLALQADAAHLGEKLPEIMEHAKEQPTLYPRIAYEGYRWAMAIDLSRCIGCQACVVACQAENNIPVVGRDEVRRGREMHWLRVDRWVSGDERDPEIRFQPLMCVHCENAPCEYVCPVNATVHSDEGLNEMVYNRCVGTRYCSNNCPYKVRRFNWRAYTSALTPTNPVRLAMNPEVTVRMRGVMEKCTYCVQRIERARITSEIENRSIRDGEIQTACQQACPTETIVFGTLSDAEARVSVLHANARRYDLLDELGTRPRTAYLARLTNKKEGY